MDKVDGMRAQRGMAASLFFEEIEEGLKSTEQFLADQIKKERGISEDFIRYKQMRRVIKETAKILNTQARATQAIEDLASAGSINDAEGANLPLMRDNSINVDHIAGTINSDEVL
jgi:hypothetical protein